MRKGKELAHTLARPGWDMGPDRPGQSVRLGLAFRRRAVVTPDEALTSESLPKKRK